MRQPNLSDVALFAAVVEAGGFRAAAQTRGMSASSLRLRAPAGGRPRPAPAQPHHPQRHPDHRR